MSTLEKGKGIPLSELTLSLEEKEAKKIKALRALRFHLIVAMVVEDPILEDQLRYYLAVAKKAQGET